MEQFNVLKNHYSQQSVNAGRPDLPLTVGRPVFEPKKVDPSSSPRGERYPIPAYLDARVKPSDFWNKH